jgi:hypothetical protein
VCGPFDSFRVLEELKVRLLGSIRWTGEGRVDGEGGDDACRRKCVSSQGRSGQGRLLTSPEESPVEPVTCGGRVPRIFQCGGSSSSSRESSGPPYLRSPEQIDVESVALLISLFLTAPGAQDGLFLNGDSFVGLIVRQPDGSAGRCRPGSGAGETRGGSLRRTGTAGRRTYRGRRGERRIRLLYAKRS